MVGYGHFAVLNNDGDHLFIVLEPAQRPDGTSGCADADGHGGNGRNVTTPATTADDPNDTYCGIPSAIKIESNVPANSNRQFTMTFGVTPRATNACQDPRGRDAVQGRRDAARRPSRRASSYRLIHQHPEWVVPALGRGTTRTGSRD